MARNGAGTFSLINTSSIATGAIASATDMMATLNDVASALTTSIASDGQTTPTADLNMGSHKHTGVADAIARNQYCSAGQAQDNEFDWLTITSGGGAPNVLTATSPIGMSTYASGQTFRFVAAATNTSAVTLSINGIAGGVGKNVTKQGTTALVAGDITSGAVCEVVYDGTQFQLINVKPTLASIGAAASGLATASGLTQSTARLLGRTTAATGAIEEITVGSNGLTLATGSIALPAVGSSGNVLTSNGTVWASTTPVSPVKAWCNFNGTTAGTNAPRAGMNITSVTRNGVGDYTLNFTSAMADTNYAIVGTGNRDASNFFSVVQEYSTAGTNTSTRSTTSVRVMSNSITSGPSFNNIDLSQINIIITGN